MTTGLQDPETMGVAKQRVSTYGYYRQPDGWITLSAATALEELARRKQGWEPLTTYGRPEVSTAYAVHHPLEQLFMLGGVKELCREQIIEMGLHLNPPLVPSCRQVLSQYHKGHNEACWVGAEPVIFPQITKEDMQSFQCHFCDRDPFPTDKARAQHEEVMHKEQKGEIRTGEALAGAMVDGLGAKAPSTEQDAGKPLPGVQHPYACGFCGEGYDKPALFLKHVKAHKEGVDDAEESTGGNATEASAETEG